MEIAALSQIFTKLCFFYKWMLTSTKFAAIFSTFTFQS